jgi:peptide/nickel transport system substrate-binding protein
MKVLITSSFSKVQSNIGLAITFSMVYYNWTKIKYPTRYCKSWTISLMRKPILYVAKDIYFQKHILFGKDSTRTVKASDFEYSLNRLLDEKSLLPVVGLQNVESFKAQNAAF